MSYPKKIVKVRPLGGIVNDLPAFEVAPEFYTSGRNVHLRASFAERTKHDLTAITYTSRTAYYPDV